MPNKYFNPLIQKESDSQQQKENGPGVFISKYCNTHFEIVNNPKQDILRVPTTEEFFFLQTDNAFNAFTFIPLIAKTYSIKELYASTYSISRKVIDALIEMHDKGMIEQITLMISDSMIKRNPVVIDNLMAMCSSRPNLKVQYAWVHAKVCLMKTQDFHFVVEGSGNWSDNAHYEQYVFANSQGLYDFRKELFTNTKLKKY